MKRPPVFMAVLLGLAMWRRFAAGNWREIDLLGRPPQGSGFDEH